MHSLQLAIFRMPSAANMCTSAIRPDLDGGAAVPPPSGGIQLNPPPGPMAPPALRGSRQAAGAREEGGHVQSAQHPALELDETGAVLAQP